MSSGGGGLDGEGLPSNADIEESDTAQNIAPSKRSNDNSNDSGSMDTTHHHHQPRSSLVATHAKVVAFLKTSSLLDASCVPKPVVDGDDKNKDTISMANENKPTSSKQQQQQQQCLRELQQQRIYLGSEVARARSQSQLSNVDLLSLHNNYNSSAAATTKASNPSSTPNFLQEAATDLDSFFASPHDDNDDAFTLPSSSETATTTDHTHLAVSLQHVRRKRKLVAAYRLGGVTAAVPRADPEVLSIRFDVCVQGEYVACYHAFFDLIVAATDEDDDDDDEGVTGKDSGPKKKKKKGSDNNRDDSNREASKLYLRLVQHTIPSPIPILELCETTLGGSLFALGTLANKEEWKTDDFKEGIRAWCRQIYRACWCWERRKQDWACLFEKQHQQQNSQTQPPPSSENCGKDGIQIENLTTNASDSLNQISFDFLPQQDRQRDYNQLEEEAASLVVLGVHLVYGDWVRGLPSSVKVTDQPHHASSSSSTTGLAAHATTSSTPLHHNSVMTKNRKKLIDLVQIAFVEKPVNEALVFLHDQSSWIDL